MAEGTLSKVLEGKFKMKAPHAPGKYHFKGVSIDTTTCTLGQAEAFVKSGSDVLVKVGKDDAPAADAKKK